MLHYVTIENNFLSIQIAFFSNFTPCGIVRALYSDRELSSGAEESISCKSKVKILCCTTPCQFDDFLQSSLSSLKNLWLGVG